MWVQVMAELGLAPDLKSYTLAMDISLRQGLWQVRNISPIAPIVPPLSPQVYLPNHCPPTLSSLHLWKTRLSCCG